MHAAIKFYTDTHIAKAVTVQLRNRGVDIIRCQDVAMDNASDSEHLEYASREDRVIVTNDQGFQGLHHQWMEAGKHHAGIIVITHDKEDIGMIVRELLFWHEAVAGGAADLGNDVRDQVHFVP